MYKGSLRDIVEHADRELPRDILPDPLPVGGHRVEEEVPQPPDDDLGPEVLPSAGHVPRRRCRADLLPPPAPRRGQEDRNDDQDRNRRPSPAAMHRHSSSTQRMQVTGQRSIASWIAAASAPSGSWTSARVSASNRNTAGTLSTHTPQAMHSSLLTRGTRFIFNPRAGGPSFPTPL